MMLMMLFSSSIEGLMRLWEEHPSFPFSLSLNGLDVMDESPYPLRWKWISDPLDCPPNERCKPESMVGTMNPLEREPHPSRVGRKSALTQR
ncbi:MAG: hypothetical protein QXY87_13125 [Saccharolobus sp.]|uniref:hypothetical protein n=1 Tax=Saccharolobus TaxID=2100760 RepID=UPI001F0D2AF7|nr:hypothetical protein [Saccharolobus shibatae]MCH4816407.1 hypothetical protein [Saccharolobus shibatae]